MSLSTDALAIPEGYTLHSENSAHILLPASADAFLNPVQEFNRDLSVACIRVWSEELNREKELKWRKHLERNHGKERKAKKPKCESNLNPRSCVEVLIVAQ
jgi:tRNA (guanine26-N2/guanine27-N2)-dimethyltransferase